jgi:hypothetical protein
MFWSHCELLDPGDDDPLVVPDAVLLEEAPEFDVVPLADCGPDNVHSPV